MTVKTHEHVWSEWLDDKKPLNLKSQETLILLSTRQCQSPDCDAVQTRIGKVGP